MRIKFKPWAKDYIKEHDDFFVQDEAHLESLLSKYDEVFLEIGCGKGRFSIEMAKHNPNVLYIALERYDSVIVKAGQKQEEEQVDNLYFYSNDIVNVKDFACLKNRISNIYLNFSDPWPKKRHAKRRLTSEYYLNIYDHILKEDGNIFFKTDNQQLFEYSLVSFNEWGWSIVDLCLDLHNTDRPNIRTEYEDKFSNQGFRINYCQLKRSKDVRGVKNPN